MAIDPYNLQRYMLAKLARAARDAQEREAWKILNDALYNGEDIVNGGEAPVVIEDVVCTKETPRALLCGIDMIEVWIPKSALHSTSAIKSVEVKKSKLVIKYWFAKKVGLL